MNLYQIETRTETGFGNERANYILADSLEAAIEYVLANTVDSARGYGIELLKKSIHTVEVRTVA